MPEGRTAVQTGPKGHQRFAYDGAGRLTKVDDTYGTDCTARVYGFSVNTNRTSMASYPAADDGTCTTSTTPTNLSSGYDTADRVTDSGYSYDAFGRTLTVPSAQVDGKGNLTIGYFANDMVASLTQGSTTRTFTLDPIGRIRSMTSASGTTVNHYTGPGDTPAWITEADGSWTRNVAGLGGLAATVSSTKGVILQLNNLHGDVVATAANDASATGVTAYFEQTEYGAARSENITNPSRYGWLGVAQRSIDSLAGLVLMGVRLYNPATGRFLQVDPVPGGSANAYDYSAGDPIHNWDPSGKAYEYRYTKLKLISKSVFWDYDKKHWLLKTAYRALGCGWCPMSVKILKMYHEKWHYFKWYYDSKAAANKKWRLKAYFRYNNYYDIEFSGAYGAVEFQSWQRDSFRYKYRGTFYYSKPTTAV